MEKRSKNKRETGTLTFFSIEKKYVHIIKCSQKICDRMLMRLITTFHYYARMHYIYYALFYMTLHIQQAFASKRLVMLMMVVVVQHKRISTHLLTNFYHRRQQKTKKNTQQLLPYPSVRHVHSISIHPTFLLSHNFENFFSAFVPLMNAMFTFLISIFTKRTEHIMKKNHNNNKKGFMSS